MKSLCTFEAKKFSLILDVLFSNFTTFLSLLSPNAMLWSFCVVPLFFQTLQTKLQEAVQLGGYIFPDISKLTTSLLQEQSLQILREHTVVAFETLTDENRRIRRIMSKMTIGRCSSHNNVLV